MRNTPNNGIFHRQTMRFGLSYKQMIIPALTSSAASAYGTALIFTPLAFTALSLKASPSFIVFKAVLYTSLACSSALFILSIPFTLIIGINAYRALSHYKANTAINRSVIFTVLFYAYLYVIAAYPPAFDKISYHYLFIFTSPLGLIAFPLCGELFHRMVSAKQCRLEEGQAPLPLAVSHQPSGQDDAGGDHGDD